MIDIVALIKREMQKRHMSPIELSRKLGVHQSTVHGILSRSTIKLERVADLSNAFQYNFFREIAEQFPYEQPIYDEALKQKEAELNKEINRLKDENKALTEDNKILNTKVDLLKEVIEKIG